MTVGSLAIRPPGARRSRPSPVTTPSAPRPSCSQLASSALLGERLRRRRAARRARGRASLPCSAVFSWWRSGPPRREPPPGHAASGRQWLPRLATAAVLTAATRSRASVASRELVGLVGGVGPSSSSSSSPAPLGRRCRTARAGARLGDARWRVPAIPLAQAVEARRGPRRGACSRSPITDSMSALRLPASAIVALPPRVARRAIAVRVGIPVSARARPRSRRRRPRSRSLRARRRRPRARVSAA